MKKMNAPFDSLGYILIVGLLVSTLYVNSARASSAPAVPPKVEAPAAPDPQIAALKTQLAQTEQAATAEINRLNVLAERNGFAFQLLQANEQNVALRNALAQEQAKSADLQQKYDMEKAKVEALLKNPGATGATATTATPAPSGSDPKKQ